MGLSVGSQPRVPFSIGLDASKPSSPLTGDIFYATDTAINYQWNGSSWVSNADLVPIGAIIPFLKSYTNTPSMPSNYVECNGQTLSDAASVFNGQVIPDLNGSGGTKRFLRGSSTSGTTGGTETHHHSIPGPYTQGDSSYGIYNAQNTNDSATLPSYYEVVWILRIK